MTGSGTGSLGVWINLDPSIPVDAVSARLVDLVSNAPLPLNYVSATVDAASRLVSNLPAQTGALPVSGAVTILASGAIQSMFYQKLMIATLAFIPLGLLAVGGGTMLGQSAGPKKPAAVLPDVVLVPPNATTSQAQPPPASSARSSDAVDAEPRMRAILETAKRRYDINKTLYERGRIELDRYLDAIMSLGSARRLLKKRMKQGLEPSEEHSHVSKSVASQVRDRIAGGRTTDVRFDRD